MRRSSILSREVTRYTACSRLCMSHTVHMIASKRSRFTLKPPLFPHYSVSLEFAEYSVSVIIYIKKKTVPTQF